jgi:hypothetical protein
MKVARFRTERGGLYVVRVQPKMSWLVGPRGSVEVLEENEGKRLVRAYQRAETLDMGADPQE